MTEWTSNEETETEATVIEAHPEETELVQLAFADTRVGDKVLQHVAECAECRGVVDALRTQANALRLTAIPTMDTTPECLDDESIAAFASAHVDPDASQAAINHLLGCARCAQEVASVARLLDASDVRIEIERLGKRADGAHTRHIVRGLAILGVLAAGLVIMLLPASSQIGKRLFREESVTGATAPRLLAPVDVARPSDTLRWTSVPRADRYRITVFARDGSVIWEAQTRDTAVALSDRMTRVPDDTILWRVEAHVGWEDRWASSALAMLTIRRAQR
jgi:hypothetical protein